MPTSATTTLAEIMESVVTTSVDTAKFVIAEYWGYILIIGIAISLIAWFKKLGTVGSK